MRNFQLSQNEKRKKQKGKTTYTINKNAMNQDHGKC